MRIKKDDTVIVTDRKRQRQDRESIEGNAERRQSDRRRR